jgi:hypothetical protein
MNVVLAIAGTVLALAIALLAMYYAGPLPALVLMAGTAIWAAVDVGRLKFADYDVTFPGNGILAVLFVLGFWLVGFPMFLAAWFAIVRKTARPRAQRLAA